MAALRIRAYGRDSALRKYKKPEIERAIACAYLDG